jgi:hypothetical protein
MDLPTLSHAELLKKWQPTIDKAMDVWSWTSHHELAWLCDCASRANEIIEIGSYHGKSAACMALARAERGGITCLDIPQDRRCQAILAANAEHFGFSVYCMTSSQFKFSGKRDFAFIDGGHLFEDVNGDIANLLPHMAPGSVLSGHDWRTDMTDGVNRGVLAHFPLEKIKVFESIWHVQL